MSSAEQDPETYSVIGAAMEVHRILGHGFLEAVYHDAFCRELTHRKVPYEREKTIPIIYKGERLDTHYKADLVCFGSIIVELKALGATGGNEKAQLINYLKASGLKRGLLINFGTPSLEYHRIVF